MSTGTEIIQDALAEIGAFSTAMPASAASIESGRRKLNSMLELWLSDNIILGTTPLEVSGDELNEPADSRNAIVYNLALQLAGPFSNGKQIVTQTLANNARSNFMKIKSLYRTIDIPDKVISSTTPLGAGNRVGAWTRQYFPKGSTISN